MSFQRIIEISAGPSGGEGVTITDNYMSFEIEKASSKGSNKASVQIYNLSDSAMNAMGAAKNKLCVKTGYKDEGGPVAIFFGDVNRSRKYKEGDDVILEIEAFDGQSIYDKNYALSCTEGVGANVVLDKILEKLAYPVENRPKLTSIYNNGYSDSGNALRQLTKVLTRENYKWMIQNAAIYIYKVGEAVTKTGLYLCSDTGLIDIEIIDESVPKKNKKGSTSVKDEDELPDYKGAKIKIKSLIHPQLYPGCEVTVAQGDSEGPFKITSVKMAGDNFGGDYFANMEAVRL